MKPFLEGKLIAVARLIHATRNRYTVEVRLLDADGRAVASGYGSFALSNQSLGDAEDSDLPEEALDSDEDAVAYGSMWRTPFGYVHQN